jgi:hypothetical protein
METFVRGGSREAISRRQHEGRPLPARRRDGDGRRGRDQHDPRLPAAAQRPQHGRLFGANVEAMFGRGQFDIGGHRTGSTDMGDIAHMMPVIHPYVASALGQDPRRRFPHQRAEHAYLTPAKLLAMTAIDSSTPTPPPAKQIIADSSRSSQRTLPRLRPRPSFKTGSGTAALMPGD